MKSVFKLGTGSLLLLALTVTRPSWAHEDIPSRGHSLFDEFLAASNGLPTSYPALRWALEKFSGRPATHALIPLGRSLQRFQTDFEEPRVVAAFDSGLFVAFAKRASSLEVISFNERLGRFEFQVVRGFGPGQTPAVYYASRALCLRCHQGGQPIFAPFPWAETDAPDSDGSLAGVRARLMKIHDEGKGAPPSYHGVRVGGERFDEVQELDGFVQGSRSLVNFHSLWPRACGSTPVSEKTCRVALVTQALEGFWKDEIHGIWDLAHPPRKQLQGWLRSSWPTGLNGISNQLSDRDPLNPSESVISDYLNPASPRVEGRIWPSPDEVPDAIDSVTHLLQAVVRSGFSYPQDVRRLKKASSGNFERLRAAISKPAVSLSLETEWFSRDSLMAALLDELEPGKAHALVTPPVPPPVPEPPPQVDPLLFESHGSAPPELQILQTHCGKCHSGAAPGSHNFLKETDPSARWERVKALPEILRRLRWEGLPENSPLAMPPPPSRAASGLTDAIRRRLIDALERAAD